MLHQMWWVTNQEDFTGMELIDVQCQNHLTGDDAQSTYWCFLTKLSQFEFQNYQTEYPCSNH